MRTILFTLDHYHIGGQASLIKSYSRALGSKYKVLILGRSGNLNNLKEYFEAAEIYVIDQKMRTSFFGRLLDSAAYLKKINCIYNNNEVDIVHFSTIWSTIYTLLHLSTWSKKLVVTFHGANDLEYNSQFNTEESNLKREPKILTRLKKELQKFVLQISQRILVLSDYSKTLIKSHYGSYFLKKITIIPGFTEMHSLTSTYCYKSDYLTIVNYGRAEPRKGLAVLLKAVK